MNVRKPIPNLLSRGFGFAAQIQGSLRVQFPRTLGNGICVGKRPWDRDRRPRGGHEGRLTKEITGEQLVVCRLSPGWKQEWEVPECRGLWGGGGLNLKSRLESQKSLLGLLLQKQLLSHQFDRVASVRLKKDDAAEGTIDSNDKY